MLSSTSCLDFGVSKFEKEHIFMRLGASELSLFSKLDKEGGEGVALDAFESTPSGTTQSFPTSSSRQGGSSFTASPPQQGMYRTQYKRVSIRPPSSDESDDEYDPKGLADLSKNREVSQGSVKGWFHGFINNVRFQGMTWLTQTAKSSEIENKLKFYWHESRKLDWLPCDDIGKIEVPDIGLL